MNENITIIDAVKITKNLVLGIELPIKCKKAIDTLNAVAGNLDVIANELEKSQTAQEAQHENADDQAETV